jgi:Asp-tRNA(Asn)/Glu-tRNA(Gln) amidotransferase A subunit family amidase
MDNGKSRSNRRDFIARAATLAATAAATSGCVRVADDEDKPESITDLTKGASPPDVDIDLRTLEEAEKLAGITFSKSEREQILRTIDEQRSMIAARVAQGALPNELPPAQIFQPRIPGTRIERVTAEGDPWSNLPDPGPCPEGDVDLAFAPVWRLGQWLRDGKISSMRLTRLSLDRLKRFDPTLHCVISLTEELALEQAAQADRELASGTWRGPLHGVPWGAKDIIDTEGIGTTWGAAPLKDRVAEGDAWVTERLREAGAVLVAKLAVGALAYGDVWFGGMCRNPFDTEQGSSGSSAGSASATAAGLVPFTLGTETYGSIISPCHRCGAAGLRPTFGRVARNGVMALCWSLDKIGPICRSVLDTALVLKAINGSDPLDPASVDEPFTFDPGQSAKGLRLAYDPTWFEGANATDADRAALEAARQSGMELVEVALPEMNTAPLLVPLFAEAAAAFEEFTRSGIDDELTWQDDQAWPNTFRQNWFIPAVELVQASRVRRQVMDVMHRFMHEGDPGFDALICPAFSANLLLITNNTGHPSLILRSGFDEDGRPIGTTLIGRLFDEGTLCRAGHAIENRLDVASQRPELFS